MKKFQSLPIKAIRLSDLKSYTEIKSIFRREGITRYLYVIKYKGKIIKFGISHKIQEPADRIYTQIGHMPGWKQPLLKRSKKTKIAIDAMIAKVDPYSFHKDHVELEIYDFTNYEFELADSDSAVYAEMQNAEEYLKQEYFKEHGKYPIGNIKQEGFRVVSSDKQAWDACFKTTISSAETKRILKEIPKKESTASVFSSLFE